MFSILRPEGSSSSTQGIRMRFFMVQTLDQDDGVRCPAAMHFLCRHLSAALKLLKRLVFMPSA
jgi:hypothetical protein